MRTESFFSSRVRAITLGALSLALAGCVATSPDQSGGQQALTDVLRTVGAGSGNPTINALAGGTGTAARPGQASALDIIEMLKQSVESIDEPREIEIGRQLSAILLGSKPLHPDMKLQAYVNQLGRWISLQSARPNLPWTFMVLDDPGFNAFAAPGGYVFVTKGLVDGARNEAELAGVIAHEIVHVVEKHHLKALAKNARADLATQLVASQLRNDLAGNVGAQFLALGKNLYAKGLDREDEYEADRKGVTLAGRAGLDPYGLPSLLHTLASVRPDNPQYLLALSTHPPTDARLDMLEQSMGTRLSALSNRPSVTVTQRLTPVAVRPPARTTTPTETPTTTRRPPVRRPATTQQPTAPTTR